jgi:peptide/nickel transport system ATP-binding protein
MLGRYQNREKPFMSTNNDVLVSIDDLKMHFPIYKGVIRRQVGAVHAVDGVSFKIKRGETLGLVGESGCGKSTTGRTILQLYKPTAGSIHFDGVDLVTIKGEELRHMRRKMQMIFQDPYASLNPRWTVSQIVAEPIWVHQLMSARSDVDQRVRQLLEHVGLAGGDADKFPHQFSGGQRQRISIARALASQPEFLVCDEPTSALDVSVQAQVLNLMRKLQRDDGLTYLFISHNLAVVHHVSDRIGVMYLGRIVEMAPKKTLFQRPQHPYTRMLLDAIPDVKMTGRARKPVSGEVPNPLNPPSGCSFHPRCPYADERCKSERPKVLELEGDSSTACHAIEERRVEWAANQQAASTSESPELASR